MKNILFPLTFFLSFVACSGVPKKIDVTKVEYGQSFEMNLHDIVYFPEGELIKFKKTKDERCPGVCIWEGRVYAYFEHRSMDKKKVGEFRLQIYPGLKVDPPIKYRGYRIKLLEMNMDLDHIKLKVDRSLQTSI